MPDKNKIPFDLSGDPYRWAKSFKEETGKPVVGYFCGYAPEEIIRAAGAMPVRITGSDRQVSKSTAHLQNYCCTQARTSLDLALEGELKFLSGTVFVHTCDTMQRLSDIWRLDCGYKFHADLVLPVRFSGKAAWEYLLSELVRFRSEVGEFFEVVSDEKLMQEVQAVEEKSRLIRELYSLRQKRPMLLSSADMYQTTLASMLVDNEVYNRKMGMFIEQMHETEPLEAGFEEKIPLFGVGSIMDQWQILDLVDEAGGAVVDDDFCTGYRFAGTAADGGGDPIEMIARRMYGGMYCPCKHRDQDGRLDMLIERIRESGAAGVVFFLFKYCEPHFFEHPRLKEKLDETGLPSILIEVEQGSVSMEAARTRIGAFLEMIRG